MYDATIKHGNIGGRFSDTDREDLSRLERLKTPTPADRGRLAAMRITAEADADRQRVESLTDRWGGRR